MDRQQWAWGKRQRGIVFASVATLVLLLAGAMLWACGSGDNEAKPTQQAQGTQRAGDATPDDEAVLAQIQDAAALLARPDVGGLTKAEQDLVQTALRLSLGRAGTVRVTSAIDKRDFAFGADGRLAMMRVFDTSEAGEARSIQVYLEPPARFCDGTEDPERIAVEEYTRPAGVWEVHAKALRPDEVPFAAAITRLDLEVAEDAGFSDEGGRRLRGLTVPFPQPADPDATVTTWIDLDDMLIRRLDVTMPSVPASYPYAFDYDVPIDIEVPQEPAAPDCVPAE